MDASSAKANSSVVIEKKIYRVSLEMPSTLHELLKLAASKNKRTKSQEIRLRLRKSFDADKQMFEEQGE